MYEYNKPVTNQKFKNCIFKEKHQICNVDNLKADKNTLQKYKVTSSGGKVNVTTGRPSVPNSMEFIKAFVNRIFDSDVKSAAELDLVNSYSGKRDDAAKAIKQKYRSKEHLAFCHIVAIKDVETSLVEFANTGNNYSTYKDWLNHINIDTDYLDDIKDASTLTKKADNVNTLIEQVNLSPYNYYLGDAPSNSSIQDHIDPHYDFDTYEMSQTSEFVIDHASELNFTIPKSDGFDGFASSSLGRFW